MKVGWLTLDLTVRNTLISTSKLIIAVWINNHVTQQQPVKTSSLYVNKTCRVICLVHGTFKWTDVCKLLRQWYYEASYFPPDRIQQYKWKRQLLNGKWQIILYDVYKIHVGSRGLENLTFEGKYKWSCLA